MERTRIENLHAGLRKSCRLNRMLQMKWYQGSGDLRLLLMISHHDKNGLTPSMLAEKLEVALPTVSRKLSVLEKQKLIYRKVSPEDRRKTFVYVTEKGREMLHDNYQHFITAFSSAAEKLGEEKTDLLLQLLDEFSGYIEEEIQKEAGDVG